MPAHTVLRELARAAGTSRPAPGRILLDASPGRASPLRAPARDRGRWPTAACRSQEYDASVAPAPAVVVDAELARGPIDEGVINPIGFHSEPDQGIAALDGAQEVTARTVAALRSHQGGARGLGRPRRRSSPARWLPWPWPGSPWWEARRRRPRAPGSGTRCPTRSRVEADVTDLLRREEHSIRLRRAALLTHCGPGVAVRGSPRQRVGRPAGSRPAAWSSPPGVPTSSTPRWRRWPGNEGWTSSWSWPPTASNPTLGRLREQLAGPRRRGGQLSRRTPCSATC